MNIRHIYTSAIILISFTSVFGQQVKTESKSEIVTQTEEVNFRTESLKKQTVEMYQALKSSDVEKLADFAHPKLIEIAGSREKYIAAMEKMIQFTNEELETYSWTVENPSNLVETGGQLIGVVRRTLKGKSFQQNEIVQTGAVIGVSIDNGKTWKFVNGPVFKTLFPTLAEKIQIPEQIHYVNGIRQ